MRLPICGDPPTHLPLVCSDPLSRPHEEFGLLVSIETPARSATAIIIPREDFTIVAVALDGRCGSALYISTDISLPICDVTFRVISL